MGIGLYPPEAVTVLRVTKVAQRLGFTLAGSPSCWRWSGVAIAPELTRGCGRGKLAEVEAKIADLTVIAETLRTALSAGCDDLDACADSPC